MNLKDSISGLIDMFKVGASEKGIQLVFDCSDDFPEYVVVDAQRIQQVLLNLLQNALKFTFQGSITVSMKYCEVAHQIHFSVTDTGVGIKPEDRQRLFTMFGKLENTMAINTSGIGIGLTICKKIVEAYGGLIQVEEHDPQKLGTTFSFTIQCGSSLKPSIEKYLGLPKSDMNSSRSSHDLMDGSSPSYGRDLRQSGDDDEINHDDINCDITRD